MRPRSLFWRLFLGIAVVLTVVLTISGMVVVRGFYRFTTEELSGRLGSDAAWLTQLVESPLASRDMEALTQLVRRAADDSLIPIVIHVFDVEGKSLAASVVGDLQGDRAEAAPEIRKALVDGQSDVMRWSTWSGQRMKYVAARVGSETAPVGVVRVGVSEDFVGAWMGPARRLVWLVALGTVVAALVLALAFARIWSRRIRGITAAARRFSRGDLSARVEVSGSDETAVLARSLNELRDNLARQLATIDRQRRTLGSLVSQLREGVVVTGSDGRLVLVNPEAARQLQLVAHRADGSFEGMTVEQCIPQHDLQELLRGSGSLQRLGPSPNPSDGSSGEMGGGYQELKLQVDGLNGPVSLLARACDISLPTASRPIDSEGEMPSVGRLLVLTDITELSRALQVKADFAANASHELRTPLSAILAAIETIRSLDPHSEATTARHFLDVIERHGRRMQAMVADLLDLSRLESALARFEPVRLRSRDVVAEMHNEFVDALEAKSLVWHVDIATDCQELDVHPDLIRIILRNLLENAIRFTPKGGRVELSVQRTLGNVRVRVADTGCGIPESEQGRVFERFYQVERARSGGDRGTGLGLSIVRHAVAAMSGTVELQSAVGEGTRVTVTIPQSA